MSDDLMRRIRLGEDSVLELKSVRVEGNRFVAPDRRDLADELAALANGAGGTLILGVREALALSGRLPEYSLIDESELRLLMWASP
ncbi:MAG: ATP-binding protein [Gammaproteobacteria bacterium]|nr:ATP-binding protein [Gammaproteobacteria bacterium]